MIQADAQDLLVTAREALLTQILPRVDGEKAYQIRMIANAMGIAAREMREAGEVSIKERQVLEQLLEDGTGDNVFEQGKLLCKRIGSGDFDSMKKRHELIEGLRSVTLAKLRISNPKLL